MEYLKINSIFKRDQKGNYIIDEFSQEEFSYLYEYPWEWDEKLDGTNIRCIWDGKDLEFKGRTDKAQIPPVLLNNMKQQITEDMLFDQFGDTPVCIYGEGIGEKIQKGGGKYGSPHICIFDILINDIWLKKYDVNNIAYDMGIPSSMGIIDCKDMTLKDMFNNMYMGKLDHVKSHYGDFRPEGFVGIPKGNFLNRMGKRIMTKIKFKDFS